MIAVIRRSLSLSSNTSEEILQHEICQCVADEISFVLAPTACSFHDPNFRSDRRRPMVLPHPSPMVRCAIQIRSAAHCNTKFSTGRESAIRLRASCSLEHRSNRCRTVTRQLQTVCIYERCRRALLASQPHHLRGLGMSVFTSTFHPIAGSIKGFAGTLHLCQSRKWSKALKKSPRSHRTSLGSAGELPDNDRRMQQVFQIDVAIHLAAHAVGDAR